MLNAWSCYQSKDISATTTAPTAESNIRLCVIVFYCSTKSLTAVNSAVKQVFFAVKWMWYSAHDRSKEQSRQRTNINNLCQTKTLRKTDCIRITPNEIRTIKVPWTAGRDETSIAVSFDSSLRAHNTDITMSWYRFNAVPALFCLIWIHETQHLYLP